jgi:CRP-like cAMP-binding protein
MAAPADTRKLKDSVAEFLKKGKWEKAVTALEELIKAEPREVAHKLKLGDALRKIGERERAIAAYQMAAKAYGDEGQLIKAIAAVKVILEIEPANAAAQAQLTEMNERRFLKPGQFMQKLGPAPKAIGSRGVSAIELEEGEAATRAIASQIGDAGGVPAGGSFKRTTEPLELDEPAPPPPRRRPPPQIEAIELPDELPPIPRPSERKQPPRRGQPLQQHLGGDLEGLLPGDPEMVELTPEPELVELDPVLPPGADAPPAQEAVELELIEVDAEPGTAPLKVLGTAPIPIADLLTDDDEIQIDSEPPPPAKPPMAAPLPGATPEDLELAFGSIVDDHEKRQRKVPVRVPLFDDLSREAFVELVNQLGCRVYQPGEVILREGDPGRSFFVISEGRVRVYKALPDGRELELAHLEEGAFFGEMAMLSGAPRTASIAAVTETTVLEVTDKVLRALVQKHPQVTQTLKDFYRQRLVNNVMAISPLFKDFDSLERKALMDRFKMRQARLGEVLIEQGAKSDGLYVVLHGAVNVSAQGANGVVDLAKLKEGDIFGEMSLLTREPATATVVAAVPSLVLKLPREQFQEMILTHPQVLELVSELTDKRRSANEVILKGQGPGVDGMAFV